MAAESEVRKASSQFYEGLNRMANGDASSVMDTWSRDTNVTAQHPIGGREVGFEAVKKSFEQVGSLASEGEIRLKDQFINVLGDVAYELGIEYGHFKLSGERLDLEHRVTNIYRRDNGEWKLVHHHTDISPVMLEALSRLKIGQDRGKADFSRSQERVRQ